MGLEHSSIVLWKQLRSNKEINIEDLVSLEKVLLTLNFVRNSVRLWLLKLIETTL